jgi:tetratricopeptide (TPR) repeat protein
VPPPATDAFAPPPAIPLPPPETPFGAPSDPGFAAQEPLPIPDDSGPFSGEPTGGDFPPPFPAAPPRLPELSTPERRAAPREEPLAFGEIDFASPPPPADLPPPDPFAAAEPPPPVPPPPLPPPSASEELEMLFGEGAGVAKAVSAAKPVDGAGALAYRIRRRSGKIFGPFDESQIAEMLAKAELMGNEDVSSDGGATWSAIGSVTAFGEALRKGAVEPPPGARAPHKPVVPFGDRMAAVKVVEGAPPPRSWKRLAIPGAVVLLVVAVGLGAGLTRHGIFFAKVFRRGDAARVGALLAEARGALDRAEYASDRAALDGAARAVAADPDSDDAAALHAMAVAALELRHGAPAGALDQARAAADRLEPSAKKGRVAALAARLAVSVASAPGAGTLPHESALEQASAKAQPDADVVALLAAAALGRGDAARAGTLFTRLEGLRPGTVRAGHGAGLALLAKRDVAGAKAAFEKVLAASPAHLPSRLELAVIAEAEGDAAAAEAQLALLLAPGAEVRLAPAERARALVAKGALLSRSVSGAAEADRSFEAAAKADPRLLEARLALARHRLRHADAAGAVAALEPVAAQAAATPSLGAVRIRALAAAGRALDAASLAEQALARSPGDPGLLLAKAAALEASAKADEAAAIYREAAARDPAAFEPRLSLGRIALARGDLERARAELAAAVEKGPREPAPHAALGQLAVAEGDAAAASRAFQAALALDPEYAPAEIGLAKLALARGDAATARVRLERALAADPRNAEGHVAHGILLWKDSDLAGAEKAFQAAVELQPRNGEALWRLGAVKLERGEDLDGAVQRLAAASNENPRQAEPRQWLGRALLRKGETPGAIAQLRKAVELEPGNPVHHVHLGAALERSGSPAEAVEAYRAAAAADPKHVDAHERLALLYAGNGRFEEAAAAYEKAISAAPRVTRFRIALADCRARLGKYDDALRGYREVLRTDPAAKQVPYKVARALHEAEGARAALPWYERAARDEGDNPMPHYYLGYLYKERGQKAKAVAEFKRFLALKPDADEKKDIEAEIEDLGGR